MFTSGEGEADNTSSTLNGLKRRAPRGTAYRASKHIPLLGGLPWQQLFQVSAERLNHVDRESTSSIRDVANI